MPTFQASSFLRRAIMLDAGASGAAALLLIAGAGLLWRRSCWSAPDFLRIAA
jgi:hypothetical protein